MAIAQAAVTQSVQPQRWWLGGTNCLQMKVTEDLWWTALVWCEELQGISLFDRKSIMADNKA